MATVEEDRRVDLGVKQHAYWAKPLINFWLRPDAQSHNLRIREALLRNIAVFRGEEIPGYAADTALLVARLAVIEVVDMVQGESLEDLSTSQRLLRAAAIEGLCGRPAAVDAILKTILESDRDDPIRAVSHLVYAMRSGLYPTQPNESISILGGEIAQRTISSDSSEQIALASDAENHMHAGLLFLARAVDERLVRIGTDSR